MSYSSNVARASLDIAFATLSQGGAVQSTAWLTDDAADDTDSHLGRAGTQLLAGWRSAGAQALALLDDAGVIVEGPVSIDANAGPKDEWHTLADGDLAWASAWGDTAELKLVRIAACTP